MGGLWFYHVSHDVKHRLPAREGSGVTTCPMTPDPTSQHRRAPTSPRALWCQTPPPSTGGLRHHHVSRDTKPRLSMREGPGVATCPAASDPPLGEGGLWCRHVSHGSRPISRHGRALSSPRATWLSACYGSQGKGKYSVGLLTRSDPPASEACLCVPKTPDIRLIMTSSDTRSRQRIKYIQDSHT
jgi:hypothetical protein